MATTKPRIVSDKSLAGINNLVKLLPTTTLLAFQTLNPSFTNHGNCLRVNKILTTTLIILCSITCAFFSITDSIMYKGKLYIGIATFRGLFIFNFDEEDDSDVRNWLKDYCRKKYKLKFSDGVHVIFTIIVFLTLSLGDGFVQSCFFSKPNENQMQLLKNLPLGFSILASMAFLLMPPARKGIGYSPDIESPQEATCKSSTSHELMETTNKEQIGTSSGFPRDRPGNYGASNV